MDIDRRSLARPILALVCATWLLAGPVAAQQQRPCLEDLKKFCPEAQPASPEARKCLVGNMDKLSEACRQRISTRNRRQGYPARLKGCEADLDKHCKGVMAGGGRLIKCLRSHESEISPECKSRIPGSRPAGTPHSDAAGNQLGSAPTAAATAQPTVPAK